MSKKLLATFVLLSATIGFTLEGASQRRLEAIQGYKNPEGIPNFYAWVHFFDTIAASHQVGGLQWYVEKQMGLEKLFKSEPKIFEQLCQTLVVASKAANREQGRLRAARGELRSKFQAGIVSQQEADDESLECIRQEVVQLRKDYLALRSSILALGSLGPRLWEEIESYVQGPLKAEASLQFHDSSFAQQQLAILRSFDDM